MRSRRVKVSHGDELCHGHPEGECFGVNRANASGADQAKAKSAFH
jgi:hypothetical protein